MNTLTEKELMEIAASGMPVASWPVAAPSFPGLNLSWLSRLLASNNQTTQHIAD